MLIGNDCSENHISPQGESKHHIHRHNGCICHRFTDILYDRNIELAPVFLNVQDDNSHQDYHVSEGICNAKIIVASGLFWITDQDRCTGLDEHDNDIGQYCNERQRLSALPSFGCYPECKFLFQENAESRLETRVQNPWPPNKLKKYHLPAKERCVNRAKPAIPLDKVQSYDTRKNKYP